MLCFLDNLPNLNLVLWVLSLEMSHAPPNSIAMVVAILILSNIHVVLHKVSLFSGDRYFMSGDHFIIQARPGVLGIRYPGPF